MCTLHWQARRKRGCIEIVGQYLVANSGTISAASCGVGVEVSGVIILHFAVKSF